MAALAIIDLVFLVLFLFAASLLGLVSLGGGGGGGSGGRIVSLGGGGGSGGRIGRARGNTTSRNDLILLQVTTKTYFNLRYFHCIQT